MATEFGMFEDIEGSETLERESSLEPEKQLARAIHDVKTEFGSYLGNSSSAKEFEERFHLASNEIHKTVAKNLFPTPGNIRKIKGALKAELKKKASPPIPYRILPQEFADGTTGVMLWNNRGGWSHVQSFRTEEAARNWVARIPSTDMLGDPLVWVEDNDDPSFRNYTSSVKKTAWAWDQKVNAYVADLNDTTFSCPSCGSANQLGFSTCSCKKIWNSYSIKSSDNSKRVLCREVMDRSNVVLGSIKTGYAINVGDRIKFRNWNGAEGEVTVVGESFNDNFVDVVSDENPDIPYPLHRDKIVQVLGSGGGIKGGTEITVEQARLLLSQPGNIPNIMGEIVGGSRMQIKYLSDLDEFTYSVIWLPPSFDPLAGGGSGNRGTLGSKKADWQEDLAIDNELSGPAERLFDIPWEKLWDATYVRDYSSDVIGQVWYSSNDGGWKWLLDSFGSERPGDEIFDSPEKAQTMCDLMAIGTTASVIANQKNDNPFAKKDKDKEDDSDSKDSDDKKDDKKENPFAKKEKDEKDEAEDDEDSEDEKEDKDSKKEDKESKMKTSAKLTPVPGAEPRFDEEGKEVVDVVTCGNCGRSWNDAAVSAWTPTPSGRCPFEYDHEYDKRGGVVWVGSSFDPIMDEREFTSGWILAESGRMFTKSASKSFLEGYAAYLKESADYPDSLGDNFEPKKPGVPNTLEDDHVTDENDPNLNAYKEVRDDLARKLDKDNNAPKDEQPLEDPKIGSAKTAETVSFATDDIVELEFITKSRGQSHVKEILQQIEYALASGGSVNVNISQGH